MNVVARTFDYKPRQPVPFKFEHDLAGELRQENPLSSQLFEVAHIGNDILLDHAHGGSLGLVSGGAAAAIGVLSAAWGVARLRSSALPDKIEAVGDLALAGSSAVHALHHLAGVHVPGGPALEVVHGLATLGLGLTELRRVRNGEASRERAVVGAAEVALGAAVAGAGLLGQYAPVLHLAAAGALAVKEVALNYSFNRGIKAKLKRYSASAVR